MLPAPTMPALASLLATIANAQNVLTVRVYDYSGLSDNTVRKSRALAGRIFRKAGVETLWIGCPTRPGEEGRFPECRGPAPEGDIILHICPKSMEEPALSPSAFGWAEPEADGRPGAHSPSGVMKAHWLPDDLVQMEMGALCFESEQVRRMRHRLSLAAGPQ